MLRVRWRGRGRSRPRGQSRPVALAVALPVAVGLRLGAHAVQPVPALRCLRHRPHPADLRLDAPFKIALLTGNLETTEKLITVARIR